MRLGGFVTSQSFKEAAANYEKEQEKNKEKPPTRRRAGRVSVIRLVVTVSFPRYPFQKNKTIQKYLTIYGSTFPL